MLFYMHLELRRHIVIYRYYLDCGCCGLVLVVIFAVNVVAVCVVVITIQPRSCRRFSCRLAASTIVAIVARHSRRSSSQVTPGYALLLCQW